MAEEAQGMSLSEQIEAWKKHKATQELDLDVSVQNDSRASQEHIPPSGGKLCFAQTCIIILIIFLSGNLGLDVFHLFILGCFFLF